MSLTDLIGLKKKLIESPQKNKEGLVTTGSGLHQQQQVNEHDAVVDHSFKLSGCVLLALIYFLIIFYLYVATLIKPNEIAVDGATTTVVDKTKNIGMIGGNDSDEEEQIKQKQREGNEEAED